MSTRLGDGSSASRRIGGLKILSLVLVVKQIPKDISHKTLLDKSKKTQSITKGEVVIYCSVLRNKFRLLLVLSLLHSTLAFF